MDKVVRIKDGDGKYTVSIEDMDYVLGFTERALPPEDWFSASQEADSLASALKLIESAIEQAQ